MKWIIVEICQIMLPNSGEPICHIAHGYGEKSAKLVQINFFFGAWNVCTTNDADFIRPEGAAELFAKNLKKSILIFAH